MLALNTYAFYKIILGETYESGMGVWDVKLLFQVSKLCPGHFMPYYYHILF